MSGCRASPSNTFAMGDTLLTGCQCAEGGNGSLYPVVKARNLKVAATWAGTGTQHRSTRIQIIACGAIVVGWMSPESFFLYKPVKMLDMFAATRYNKYVEHYITLDEHERRIQA